MLKNKSNWDFYAVKIIKQIIIEGEPDLSLIDNSFNKEEDEQLFEESIMLVRAQSTEHAYKVAEKKTTELNEPYQNAYGQQVSWKFIKAVDCYLILNELKSGTEVYSCLHNVSKNQTVDEILKKWFTPSY